MKNIFPGYYSPSESDYKKLWSNCLFVFDANVLLNLYRYTQKTREEVLNIFSKISDRIWIPHQVAYEYQKNRLNVIKQQLDVYSQIQSVLDKTKKEISTKINSNRYHPSLDEKSISELFDTSFKDFIQSLNTFKNSHPDFINNDTVRSSLDNIFSGKVGPAFPPNKMREIFLEGEERYKNNVPPGFKDVKDKQGTQIYGDLVLWFQILSIAKELTKPVILVTDEKKEDWWLIDKGQTIGPLPELINEFYSETNQMFHLYKIDNFITQAKKFLKERATPEAIKEIREIRKYDENINSSIQTVKNIINSSAAIENFTKISALLNSLNDDAIQNAFNTSTLQNALAGFNQFQSYLDQFNKTNIILPETKFLDDFIENIKKQAYPTFYPDNDLSNLESVEKTELDEDKDKPIDTDSIEDIPKR